VRAMLRDAFGAPCRGVHALRLGGLALVDVLATAALAAALMVTVVPPAARTPAVAALLAVACFAVGEVAHVALGVRTAVAATVLGPGHAGEIAERCCTVAEALAGDDAELAATLCAHSADAVRRVRERSAW
jgi:hypothetical protein